MINSKKKKKKKKNKYSAFNTDDIERKSNNEIQNMIFNIPNAGKDKLLSPDKPHELLGETVISPDLMVELARRLKSQEGYSAIFYMSPKLKVRGIQEIPTSTAEDYKKLKNFLEKCSRIWWR